MFPWFPFSAPKYGLDSEPADRRNVLLESSDGMEHWPGHERAQTTNKSKDEREQKEHRPESNFWQWPHLEHGSIGRTTLVSKNGRVQWSSVVDTSHGMWTLCPCCVVFIHVLDTRWLPLGRPAKVFPETRPPQVDIHEHSSRQRAEKGVRVHLSSSL